MCVSCILYKMLLPCVLFRFLGQNLIYRNICGIDTVFGRIVMRPYGEAEVL